MLRCFRLLSVGGDVSSAVVEGRIGSAASTGFFCALCTNGRGALACCFSTPEFIPLWYTYELKAAACSNARRRVRHHRAARRAGGRPHRQRAGCEAGGRAPWRRRVLRRPRGRAVLLRAFFLRAWCFCWRYSTWSTTGGRCEAASDVRYGAPATTTTPPPSELLRAPSSASTPACSHLHLLWCCRCCSWCTPSDSRRAAAC